ncbi:hypothetical protein ACFFK0_06290 [Paenibacillus chartarius]|uniref:Uncharacterized protein n=1 Tax=Paenibacillus chartarius TaxID=747481 RepID=A0ABV6DHE5_9BACL
MLSHLILVSIGALTWVWLLERGGFGSSAANSLTIAYIGVVWGIGMLCLVQALLAFSQARKE